MKFKNIIGHFSTITHHKNQVMKNCFKVGLYRQGLAHDLSKYNPIEFLVGCKYYQGFRSPNAAERDEKGYSAAWLHHKGRNKHHSEYWIDMTKDEVKGYHMAGMKMPVNYVVENFMDRIAASKIYKKEDYSDNCPLEYFNITKDVLMMHPESKGLLEELLIMLSEKGEKTTFEYIRKEVLGKKH